MKSTVLLLISASTVLLSSCSHFEYGHYYSADTAKKYECEARMIEKAFLDDFFKPYSAENIATFEKQSGYSECKVNTDGKELSETVCKNPVLYKVMYTTKEALCNKFMVENKLI